MVLLPSLKHQNKSTSVLQEMNHLDSEQSGQNSTLKPHSVLFAMQLKARDLFHFLPCVSCFSNEVFNSRQHARHVQALCWASHSTSGILTQNRTELLIHSLQMPQPHLADRQRGLTGVRGPPAPKVGLWDSGIMAFRRVIIDQVKFLTQGKWWLKENTLFHNRNGLHWFALNNLNLVMSTQRNVYRESAMRQGLWVYARDHSIQEPGKWTELSHSLFWNNDLHWSPLM